MAKSRAFCATPTALAAVWILALSKVFISCEKPLFSFSPKRLIFSTSRLSNLNSNSFIPL